MSQGSVSSTHRPVRAAVILFAATTVWAASYVAMKPLGLKQLQILPQASTWFITALSLLIRFGLSALLMGLWCARDLRSATRREWALGVGLGLFGGAGIVFQMDGVQHTAASTAAFLTQCYCVFIPITLALHRRKIPGAWLTASCATALAGVAVLSNIDWHTFRLGRGELESIAGSILFTGQILWLERPLFQGTRYTVSTFIMFATVAVIVLPLIGLAGGTIHDCAQVYASWPAIGLILFLTLAGTLATYTVMNYWQPHLPATQAGLIYCCEPVFTSLLALFAPKLLSEAVGVDYANEGLTRQLLIGGGLITAANLVAMRATLQPSPLPPATNHAA